MDHTKIIDKIRKLLSLSKSDNEHEAAAAAAKAHELLSRYNLSMSDVPDQNNAQAATTASSKTRQRLEKWAFTLAWDTAYAFDCKYWHQAGDSRTVFVGVGADPEVCSWTYSYLYKTLLRMGSAYLRGPCRRLRTSKSRREARESYLRGVVRVVATRLAEQKKQSPITESALVPVKRQAIQDAMPDNLRTRNFKPLKLRNRDICNGMADGENIPLSTPMRGRRTSTAIQ